MTQRSSRHARTAVAAGSLALAAVGAFGGCGLDSEGTGDLAVESDAAFDAYVYAPERDGGRVDALPGADAIARDVDDATVGDDAAGDAAGGDDADATSTRDAADAH